MSVELLNQYTGIRINDSIAYYHPKVHTFNVNFINIIFTGKRKILRADREDAMAFCVHPGAAKDLRVVIRSGEAVLRSDYVVATAPLRRCNERDGGNGERAGAGKDQKRRITVGSMWSRSGQPV